MQGDKSSMAFWVTPLSPGSCRVIMHMSTAAELPLLLKLLVRGLYLSRAWGMLSVPLLCLCFCTPSARSMQCCVCRLTAC